MSDDSGSNSIFGSLGSDFCWHARSFAAMYGKEYVDTIHILLAAAEITPVELHGHDELTPLAISAALANMGVGNDAVQMVETLPTELTPAAQAFVTRVMSYAARTARPPSLGDIWVALAHEGGFVRRVLGELSIDKNELRQRVSGL
jgi:hypothetical protein